MQILIRCSRPQALAAKLFEHDHAVEVKIHADGKGLLLKTRDAGRFYLAMNKLAMDGFEVENVAPVDDDVNSLYEYLIGNEEPAR